VLPFRSSGHFVCGPFCMLVYPIVMGRSSCVVCFVMTNMVYKIHIYKSGMFISLYLILLAALGPGVHSAPNKNEYQKQ
jgi:hypothetical protein